MLRARGIAMLVIGCVAAMSAPALSTGHSQWALDLRPPLLELRRLAPADRAATYGPIIAAVGRQHKETR